MIVLFLFGCRFVFVWKTFAVVLTVDGLFFGDVKGEKVAGK